LQTDVEIDFSSQPRRAIFFAASVTVHAIAVAAAIYFAPSIDRPSHEIVLAYFIDMSAPGHGSDSRRKAGTPDAAPVKLATRFKAVIPRHPPRAESAPSPSTRAQVANTTPASSGAGTGSASGVARTGSGASIGPAGEGGADSSGVGGAGDAIAYAGYGENPLPEYPTRSRRRGEEGVVQLRVLVGADGLVMRVELVRSSRFAALDESAIRTVASRWRFVPARRGGREIESWVIVPIRFVLNQARAAR
jgi:protein TonB